MCQAKEDLMMFEVVLTGPRWKICEVKGKYLPRESMSDSLLCRIRRFPMTNRSIDKALGFR